MRKIRRRDGHENPDRWIVSYADFITLMFVFFTAMYAISHVDIGKLERFAGSMRSAFKATGTDYTVSTIIEGIKPINYADLRLQKEIKSKLEGFGKIHNFSIVLDERGVLISFGDSAIFDTGSAGIRDEAEPLLSSVAAIIRRTQNNIVIEGHTDNVPIRGPKYPSNWELSTARATSVLMYLMSQDNIDPSRFSAAGYGQYRPILSNATPEGRARNRRVDIIFVSKKDER